MLHPDIAARLKDEVFTVANQESEVTKDTVRQLRYCKLLISKHRFWCDISDAHEPGRAFINEVLRLFPPIPLK